MHAGSGAANNLIRSLHMADPRLAVVGCNDDRFLLKKSVAGRNFLVPPTEAPEALAAFQYVIGQCGTRLVIPTTDTDVRWLAAHRDGLSGCVLLPTLETIELCQDKFALTTHLRRFGIRVAETREISTIETIEAIFRRLEPSPYLWCRLRRGAGSLAALAVSNVEQATAWVRYWMTMRGLPAEAFTLSEFLPGRDFACQSVWKNGCPILLKTTERLTYFQAGGNPSGVSSIGAVHRTVFDPRVAELATAAVFAVDRHASGAFSVDLKEDRHGRPCVTEINAGRFLTGSTIFDVTGRHNMTMTYTRLGLGENPEIGAPYDVVEEQYMVRDLDERPEVFSAEELSTGFEDVTTPLQQIGRTYGHPTTVERIPVTIDANHRSE